MIIKSVVISIVSTAVVLLILYAIFQDEIHLVFKTSSDPTCTSGICVRFCCYGEYLCDTDESVNVSSRLEAVELGENYSVLKGKPCADGYFEDDDMPWKFLVNGYVYDVYNDTYSWNQYCVAVNSTIIKLRICSPEHKVVHRVKLLYPYLMMISLPFLFLTLFVYICVRELRNQHGKSLMAYVLTLIVMYTILTVVYLFDRLLVENYNKICKALGYILMTSIFMCFFWLNVMCHDIYTTFKGKGIKKNDTKFIKCCAYAIGIPSLIVFLAFILNEYKIIHEDYASKIGNESCTVTTDELETTKTRQLIYIYAPIILFITIDTIFYSVTAFKIYRVQKETSIVKHGESSRHATKEKAR